MPLTFSETAHRYRLDGKAVPSVTTLLKGGLPKDALTYWAARTVAEYVADNQAALENLRDMGREPMVQALKAVPWQARNEAAMRGTEIHALGERIAAGEEVDVPAEHFGAVMGYADWLDAFNVTPLLVEKSCANRTHWYAGRFDLIADVCSTRWMLDLKTSKSVYGETALQLAAYAHAEFYVHDDDPHTEFPMPEVERYGVLHVTDTGTELVPMATGDEPWQDFLAVAQVAKRRKAIDSHKFEPITTPSELEMYA